MKLNFIPLCQVAAKVKVTNLDMPVSDEVSFTHTYGRWTLREDIKSSSNFKVTAGYQISDSTNVSVEADFPKRAMKAVFSRTSSWMKCDATLMSEGGFQLGGTLGTQSYGGNIEFKVQDRIPAYTIAFYAKRPSFDLMLSLFKAKSDPISYNFSLFRQLNQYVELFALVQYDTGNKGKTADVTLTCKYDESNWVKAQITTGGEVSCSLIHSIGPSIGLSYGMQTNLTGIIRGNADVKYGMKLKLGN